MKNMINTIGKKIHTLVKENTPYRHKNQVRMWFQSKVHIFLRRLLCFLPYCCANIGREVRLMLPAPSRSIEHSVNLCFKQTNTYQEIFDTHTCLNF